MTTQKLEKGQGWVMLTASNNFDIGLGLGASSSRGPFGSSDMKRKRNPFPNADVYSHRGSGSRSKARA